MAKQTSDDKQTISAQVKPKVSRRSFVHWCGAAATVFLHPPAQGTEKTLQTFSAVRLVDHQGQGIRAAELEPEREYVFFYPYFSTPCFLLRLAQPPTPQHLQTASGDYYEWPGGVGPEGTVVAFVAICSHKLTHPSEPVSFIGYRPQPVGFLNQQNKVVQRGAVIQCCSEHSIYDPAQGCRVLAGPAPQPLGSVALEERGGELFASGIYGGLLYERFFERFGFRLDLEFANKAREPVTGQSQVIPIEDYTRQRIQC